MNTSLRPFALASFLLAAVPLAGCGDDASDAGGDAGAAGQAGTAGSAGKGNAGTSGAGQGGRVRDSRPACGYLGFSELGRGEETLLEDVTAWLTSRSHLARERASSDVRKLVFERKGRSGNVRKRRFGARGSSGNVWRLVFEPGGRSGKLRKLVVKLRTGTRTVGGGPVTPQGPPVVCIARTRCLTPLEAVMAWREDQLHGERHIPPGTRSTG